MNKVQKETVEILHQLVNKQNNILEQKEKRIAELEQIVENKLDEIKLDTDCEINCGIGIIEYKTPDNIQLASIMQSLESAIKNNNALFVWQVLQTIENKIG